MNNNFFRIDHYGVVVSEIGSARLDREESNEGAGAEAKIKERSLTRINAREWNFCLKTRSCRVIEIDGAR